MNQKPWYQSKTILLAIAQALLGIYIAVATQYGWVGGLAIAKSIVDMYIRVGTNTLIQ